mmetsp:Transcript_48400/g.137457  ORF Transcript_48400/g.137457 Transcript_48400/m.137457 type:complete len:196 (+) Transcript_48400:141-728(+)
MRSPTQPPPAFAAATSKAAAQPQRRHQQAKPRFRSPSFVPSRPPVILKASSVAATSATAPWRQAAHDRATRQDLKKQQHFEAEPRHKERKKRVKKWEYEHFEEHEVNEHNAVHEKFDFQDDKENRRLKYEQNELHAKVYEQDDQEARATVAVAMPRPRPSVAPGLRQTAPAASGTPPAIPEMLRAVALLLEKHQQ